MIFYSHSSVISLLKSHIMTRTLDGVSSFLIGTILVPIFLLTLRNLLGKEIAYWMSFFDCYFFRPFDLDMDPKTHDWAMIYNAGNGEWSLVSLTFEFGWNKQRNGVMIHRYSDNMELLFIQRLSFIEWDETGKAKLVKDSEIKSWLKTRQ